MGDKHQLHFFMLPNILNTIIWTLLSRVYLSFDRATFQQVPHSQIQKPVQMLGMIVEKFIEKPRKLPSIPHLLINAREASGGSLELKNNLMKLGEPLRARCMIAHVPHLIGPQRFLLICSIENPNARF